MQDIMDFPSAIQKVIKGYKVTKLEWKNPAVFVFIYDEYLTITKEDGNMAQLILREADLVGTDWVIVE